MVTVAPAAGGGVGVVGGVGAVGEESLPPQAEMNSASDPIKAKRKNDMRTSQKSRGRETHLLVGHIGHA
jgi:hypothetical protein